MDNSEASSSPPEKKPQINHITAVVPIGSTTPNNCASPSPTKPATSISNNTTTTKSPPVAPASVAAVTTPTPQNHTTTTASSLSSSAAANSLTVDQIDIEILPVIYEIIRSIEKDPTDIAAKQRESQDCSQKVLELHRRLEAARNQIRQLPGINYNKEEQLQRLDTLRNQLVLKQQLIKKYKHTEF